MIHPIKDAPRCSGASARHGDISRSIEGGSKAGLRRIFIGHGTVRTRNLSTHPVRSAAECHGSGWADPRVIQEQEAKDVG